MSDNSCAMTATLTLEKSSPGGGGRFVPEACADSVSTGCGERSGMPTNGGRFFSTGPSQTCSRMNPRLVP
jgi:hypothetical protein